MKIIQLVGTILERHQNENTRAMAEEMKAQIEELYHGGEEL